MVYGQRSVGRNGDGDPRPLLRHRVVFFCGQGHLDEAEHFRSWSRVSFRPVLRFLAMSVPPLKSCCRQAFSLVDDQELPLQHGSFYANDGVAGYIEEEAVADPAVAGTRLRDCSAGKVEAAKAQSSGSPALRSPSRRCSRSLRFLWTRRGFQLSIVKPGLIRSTSAAAAFASSSCPDWA